MTAAQWDTHGKAYAVAYRDALHAGGYTAGVYGPWDVLTWCRDLGGYVMFWQSMSIGFSAKRNKNPFPGAHLIQRFGAATGGLDADHNEIRRSDWADPTSEDDMALDADDIQYQLERVPAVAVAGGRVSYSGARALNTTAADGTGKALLAVQAQADAVAQRVAAVEARPAGAPTDAQVATAVVAALQDPAVLAVLGPAVAAHLAMTTDAKWVDGQPTG
jgi:hypothetical protein